MKAITLQQALRNLNAEAPASKVDIFVQHVNLSLASKDRMAVHRCSPAMGHYYHVAMPLQVTPDECKRIEERFREGGWKDVKVVFWQGTMSVTLDCHEMRNWEGYYNGKPLSKCLAQSSPESAEA